MIKLRINTNTKRETVIVTPESTLRSVLSEQNVNFSSTPIFVDGAPIQVGDLDRTLTDLNMLSENGHNITAVIKADNGK